jgi:4-hydroxy-2-oxoheptanedioate aldolase
MRTSHVKQVWKSGGIAVGTLVKSIDPVQTEILSQMDFDCLWIDLEHSDKSVETFAGLTRAARAGKVDVLARPARWEYMRMGRLLEAGAHGIMYPRCESAKEAAEAVKWAKFHPQGERGFDGGSADNNYGSYPADDYTRLANDNTWMTIQVESPAALGEVEAIADVEGVDCVFFGPGDFSALSGRPGQVRHPETLKAAETVAKAAIKAGKVYGTLVFDMDHARIMKDMGARLLVHGADMVFIKQAYKNLLEAYTDLRPFT